MTVKRLEKMKIRLEEKYKELLKTSKDDGLVFERTGINALVVDELHLFKKLDDAVGDSRHRDIGLEPSH